MFLKIEQRIFLHFDILHKAFAVSLEAKYHAEASTGKGALCLLTEPLLPADVFYDEKCRPFRKRRSPSKNV